MSTAGFEWILSGMSGITLVILGVTYGDARARLIEHKEKLTRIEDALFNGIHIHKEDHDRDMREIKEMIKNITKENNNALG